MSLHNLQDKLTRSHLTPTGQVLYVPGTGYLHGWGTTVGNSVQGWAKGALFLDTDASSGAQFWINEGTSAAASWKGITSLEAANTWAGLQTFAAGLTVSANQTAAVTTADKLTVGGVIVPQSMVISGVLLPHASLVTRDLFYAQTDGWTVTGVVATPCLVQGAAVTAVISKAAGTSAPAAATTPLHTSTIDTNATAYTPQVLTLTGTGADLILAATNRIGITFSAALDTGVLAYSIKLKRS